MMVREFATLLTTIALSVCGQTQPAATTSAPQGSTAQEATGQATAAAAPTELRDFANLVVDDNTPEARRLGAAEILKVGTDEAGRLLADILTATPPDEAAQLAICEALAAAEKPTPALIDPLLAFMGDNKPIHAEKVTRALRRFDRTVVMARITPIALDHNLDVSRRCAAVVALGALSDDISSIRVLASLLKDGKSTIRAAALQAFVQATAVRHESPAAAWAWWKTRENYSAARWSEEVSEARRSHLALTQTEKESLVRRLVTAYRESYLHTPESDRGKRLLDFIGDEQAAIRNLGLDLINDLITDRKDINADTRTKLLGLIADTDPLVRLQAARIAGDLRLAGAAPKIIDVLANEPDQIVRAAQVDALGRLDEPSAVKPLIARLDDEVPAVVAEAAEGLGNVGRKGNLDAPTTAELVRALIERFDKMPSHQHDVRARFLSAMARIAAQEFRPILKRELAAENPITVRCAAISALAAFGEAGASDDVRDLVRAVEPEIRLAAIDALGACGKREVDLEALELHLYPRSESDPAVRQRARDSFLAVANRLPLTNRMHVSDGFDRANDDVAQRIRSEVLKNVKNDTVAFEQLTRKERADIYTKLADAQLKLTDYAAAAVSYDQAASLIEDPRSPPAQTLSIQAVRAKLLGREDSAAIARTTELVDGDPANGEVDDASGLSRLLIEELRARLEAADDAVSFTGTFNLIDLTKTVPSRLGQLLGDKVSDIAQRAIGKRSALVDKLLSSDVENGDFEKKLVGFGKDVVVPRVYAKLVALTPTTAPAQPAEDRLVNLARKLLPDWEGYEPGCPEDERNEALHNMAELVPLAAPRGLSSKAGSDDE
jgi:HEAT repeat protein